MREQDEQLGIRLVYLPPYSPDLMTVERLWSWLRQGLTYLRCHADAADLVDRIGAFFERLLDTLQQVHRRLVPKLHLDPNHEKLLVSK